MSVQSWGRRTQVLSSRRGTDLCEEREPHPSRLRRATFSGGEGKYYSVLNRGEDKYYWVLNRKENKNMRLFKPLIFISGF